MLHCYLDDSQTMNGGTICLAGYVATDEGWADFANAWLPLAQKHHFQWLHTSDFLTGNAEYANLGLCQEQRVALLREFISLINNHLDFGVVVAVDTVALIQLTKGSKPRVEKNQWCLSRALRHIFEVSGLFPQSGPISLICDRGQSEGHMLGAYNALKKRPQSRMCCDQRACEKYPTATDWSAIAQRITSNPRRLPRPLFK